ncbi:MAG: Mth938-like domain-containing protein [Tistlia sp.]|uniref:Mth938-like domain-containing protein n=1 Tax=Tistlia sp. TaxID=3057121 RepID=UPI0034A44237
MDITPHIAEGRQLVERYGAGRFRVTGRVFEGSVLVTPEVAVAWPVTCFEELTVESLEPLLAAGLDVLLLGCGPRLLRPAKSLREAVRARGPVLEPMDTGAAARTYNVLMAEERRVGAALIAID